MKFGERANTHLKYSGSRKGIVWLDWAYGRAVFAWVELDGFKWKR